MEFDSMEDIFDFFVFVFKNAKDIARDFLDISIECIKAPMAKGVNIKKLIQLKLKIRNISLLDLKMI